MPTDFVWGTADAFAPPDSGEALLPTMRDATLTRIAGAGHLPWKDAPEATAAAVRASLGRAIRLAS